MSVDSWKSIFDWVALIGVFVTLTAGIGAVWTGNIINDCQGERLRKFDSDLTAAKSDLAAQQERTAVAQKAADDAALALEKFKQPRILSPSQQAKLIKELKPFAGQNFALAIFPDPEPQALARKIDELLKASGWKRVPAQIQRDGGVLMEISGDSAAQISDSGIDAYIAPDDKESVVAQHAFCSAMMGDGIPCESHRTPQLAGKVPRAITISIGKKPVKLN